MEKIARKRIEGDMGRNCCVQPPEANDGYDGNVANLAQNFVNLL